MNKKIKLSTILLCVTTVALCVVSMGIGHYKVDVSAVLPELFGYWEGASAQLSTGAGVLLNIRLPRTISALLVGGALAVSGLTFQTVFKNRLASPDLLGVSTGSCVGAALCIILGMGSAWIQFGAFTMGIATVALTWLISCLFQRERNFALILSGVLVGGVMTSILGLIKYLANPETQLPTIIYWTMGDISTITMAQIGFVIIPMLLSMVLLWLLSWQMNHFAVNEDVAQSSGANMRRLRVCCVVCATLLTACAVSVAGTISWVGLAVPQVVRLVAGKGRRIPVALTILAGGAFILAADIVGRMVSKAEIPMSVLTGIPGILIFILCVYFTNKKEESHAIGG